MKKTINSEETLDAYLKDRLNTLCEGAVRESKNPECKKHNGIKLRAMKRS